MTRLSAHELEQGRGLIDQFSVVNPTLVPKELGFFVPQYKNFVPIPCQPEGHGLMSTAEAWCDVLEAAGQFEQVVILASGISAGGKDALRDAMLAHAPDKIHRLVTGTSRKIRTEKGEVDGVDYYFFDDIAKFMSEVAALQFIEYVAQGKKENLRYYGLPKKSLDAGLAQSKPIIWCQVEMTAWETVQEYLREGGHQNVAVVKLFVLPAMKFSDYNRHLRSHRDDDIEGRLVRTGWEIGEAPKKGRSDILVSNVFSADMSALKMNAQAVVGEVSKLLRVS